MIDMDGLTKRLEGGVAVDGLSLQVEEGTAMGLVGPLGAGKSTVLRILATLATADNGAATVGGVSVAEDPASVRRLVGYVPEELAAYPRLSAREHLEFYAGVHGVPRPRRRPVADELLEALGLADHRNDDVSGLSRGSQRRLALARSLVHDPPVLLLDEPCTGLDSESAEEMEGALVTLADMGRTILAAGRQVGEVASFVTSVAVIRRGQLVTCGPVSEFRREAEPGRPEQARR